MVNDPVVVPDLLGSSLQFFLVVRLVVLKVEAPITCCSPSISRLR